MPRRSGRSITQPKCYLGLIETQVVILDDGVEDPLSYKQAMNDRDKDQLVKTMNLEMESMYFNSKDSYPKIRSKNFAGCIDPFMGVEAAVILVKGFVGKNPNGSGIKGTINFNMKYI